MKRKYLLHPGNVISKEDGDKHYISPLKLCDLYGVHPDECLIVSDRTKNDDSFIHLHPRHDGNYELPVRKGESSDG